MVALLDPVTHKSDRYGWAGWIHWETSGAHFYAWETPVLFFSVDIYTCKQFDAQTVVKFTKDFFDATRITAQDFSSNNIVPGRNFTVPSTITTPVVKYTLTEDEIRRLSTRLLREQPPRTRDRYICYHLQGTDEFSNLGRHIEREVFEEKFGNDDAWMRKLYSAYDGISTIFVIIDQEDMRPIAALRVIRHSPIGFLTLSEMKRIQGLPVESFEKNYQIHDFDKLWDYGTLAIPQKYRTLEGHLITAIIYRAAILRSRYEGIEAFMGIVDITLIRTLQFLGVPMWRMIETQPFEYEGSDESQVLFGYTTEFFASVEKRAKEVEGPMKEPMRMWADRFVRGLDIDQRLMFKYSDHPKEVSQCTRSERSRL